MMRIYKPPAYTPKKRPLGLPENRHPVDDIKISPKANAKLAKSWSAWVENAAKTDEERLKGKKPCATPMVVKDAANFQKKRVLEKLREGERKDLSDENVLKPCPRVDLVHDWATNDCKPILLPYTLGFKDNKALKMFKLREKRGLRDLNRRFKFTPKMRPGMKIMKNRATNQRHPLILPYSW